MSTPEVTLGQITEGVEVRIRTEEYASDEAVYLTHVPFQALEQLVQWIGKWGVAIDGNTYTSCSGQFAITNRGAFFEVIVSTTEDD